MPGTLGWGVLAPGFIAEMQVADLLSAGFRVTAVGSRDLGKAEAFADRFDIPNRHGSYEDLVQDPDVDVVYVASPHSHHYRHARLALEAGKHVLVEKAFTVNAEQASALVDLAEQRGLVILEAMWSRFLPHMVRIREIIASGAIGEVRSVIAEHLQKLPSDPTHRLNDPALAGGALLDLGIYPLSFAFDILGEPSRVHAISTPTETGVDRQTTVTLGYPAGEQAMVQFALDTPGRNGATIVGTDGFIDIDPTWYNAVPFTVRDADGAVIERFEGVVEGRGMQYQAAELERLVGEDLLAGEMLPPRQSVRIMALLDEVRRQIGLEYPADIMAL